MAKPKVKGLNQVKSALAKLQKKYGTTPVQEVSVVYTAPYALFVHEDLEADHPNGGQAKYLSQPARDYRTHMQRIVQNAVKGGAKLVEAAYLAAVFLLSKSKPLVPVDTGELVNSGSVQLGSSKETAGSGIGMNVSEKGARFSTK